MITPASHHSPNPRSDVSQLDSVTAHGVTELTELCRSGPIALLTGAGISTDSGIPDYRGAGTPPRTPMNISSFLGDNSYRQRFWAGARVGSNLLERVQPNAGHLAITQLENAGKLSGVITQNVDGLHTAAGTQNVAELHGSGSLMRCVPEGHRFTRAETLHWFDTANPGYAEQHAATPIAPDGDAAVRDTAGVRVPVCPACGGMLRPDVVAFGEHSNPQVFAHAETIVNSAAVLIVAGSSLAVNTGVRLVHRAEKRGIPLAIINRGATTIDQRPAVRVRLDAGTSEVLSALAGLLRAGSPAA